jgi:DNA primase catalytic subunit
MKQNYKQGFQQARAKLDKLEELTKRTFTLREVLTDDFISRHTQFKTLDEFLAAGGFQRPEEIAIGPQWDQLIARHTQFANWDELKQAAMLDLANRHLSS